MKRILCQLLAGVMALGMPLAFTACAQKSNADKLVCGVTEYKPMNYIEDGDWIGFDTEFALNVGEKLNMDVVFQKIEWKNKYTELESGAINCIWNGFTANSVEADTGKPRSEYVDFSYSYMLNQQCVVIRLDRIMEFGTMDDLIGMTVAAEKGSAGESFAREVVGGSGKVIDSSAQLNTLIEVKSGAVDFAMVDILLAQALTGLGDYLDLTIADLVMDAEVYAVGFKKGSELTPKVNKAIKELYDDGTLEELALKYGLESSLSLDMRHTEF